MSINIAQYFICDEVNVFIKFLIIIKTEFVDFIPQ